MDESYYSYWGKADKDAPTNKYHLLPYHCLDVAAVGWILIDPEKSLCKALARSIGVAPAWLHDFFCFCLAIHDLGKFSRAFQGLQPDLSPNLVKSNPRMSYIERHDSLGFWLWRDNLCKQVELSNPASNSWLSKIEPWVEIVTGHHGMPPKKSGGRVANSFEQEDEKSACHFIRDVYNLFLSKFNHNLLLNKNLKKRLKMVSWQLAGIAVLADWLGSNSVFDYYSEPMDLEIYWENLALPSAEKAVQLMPEQPNVSKFQDIADLFPFINQPTPLQDHATNEPLSDGPQLYILEDVTGAGKTEAALVLAHRLLSKDLANGLYVALPTMATANAMYDRLGSVYRRLYDMKSTPSLVLAHGARNLSDAFIESVFIPKNRTEEMIYADNHGEEEDLSATAYCNAWLADNRKKALLADVGVGTLDQALLAVLPARHQSLRMLGLGKKVLLVDEVHAYDSYMQRLLDALLEAHARQGGSVILLSATLPKKMRQKLVDAYYRGIGSDTQKIGSIAYPLASHASIKGLFEKNIDTRKEVKRTILVQRLEKEEAVIRQIQQAVSKGQCVCWIRNTVKAAWQSHHDLAKCDWFNSDNLYL